MAAAILGHTAKLLFCQIRIAAVAVVFENRIDILPRIVLYRSSYPFKRCNRPAENQRNEVQIQIGHCGRAIRGQIPVDDTFECAQLFVTDKIHSARSRRRGLEYLIGGVRTMHSDFVRDGFAEDGTRWRGS